MWELFFMFILFINAYFFCVESKHQLLLENNSFFDISFFVNEDETLHVNLSTLVLSSPHRFLGCMKAVLCPQPSTCKVTALFYSLEFFMKTLPMPKLPAVAVMQLFLRQRAVQLGLDKSTSSLVPFNWNSPSFGLLLPFYVQEYAANDQRFEFLLDYLIPSIKNACSDMTAWSAVSLHAGFVVADLSYDQYQIVSSLCELLQTELQGLRVRCHVYTFQTRRNESHEEPLFIFHNLPEGVDEHWDCRESLAREVYDSEDLDYYILLDDSVAFRTSTWILMSVAKLADNIGYFSGMGVGTLQSTSDDGVTMPVVPVLHRTHFLLFENYSLFRTQNTVILNNLLLIDVYSPYKADYRYHIPYLGVCFSVECPTERMMGDLTQREIESLTGYMDHVVQSREYLTVRLNAVFYSRNPIPLMRQSLSYNAGDMLSDTLNDSDTPETTPCDNEIVLEPAVFNARIAFITAVFGRYESTLKWFAHQYIPSDFICFTDDSNIRNNGNWIVDTRPYHLEALQYDLEHNVSHEINSLHNNQHPFNIAKYYKTNFLRIPRLAQYDVVVWLDGTIEVHNPNTSSVILDILENHNQNIIAFPFDVTGSLKREIEFSMKLERYSSSFWNGYEQPVQPLLEQYREYLRMGYNDTTEYWNSIVPDRPIHGHWISCFLALNVRQPKVLNFLTLWSDHIRRYSTEDQVSFSFLVQTTHVYPYALVPQDGYLSNLIGDLVYFNAWINKKAHDGEVFVDE